MASMPVLLELQSLSLERGGREVVSALSGMLCRGTLTAVVGPNGAGKSTLVDALAARLSPCGGRVVRAAGLRVAHLPQQSALDRSFPIRVGDVVALGGDQRGDVLVGAHATHLLRLGRGPGRDGREYSV